MAVVLKEVHATMRRQRILGRVRPRAERPGLKARRALIYSRRLVRLRPPNCSCRMRKQPAYYRLPECRFEFVPLGNTGSGASETARPGFARCDLSKAADIGAALGTETAGRP